MPPYKHGTSASACNKMPSLPVITACNVLLQLAEEDFTSVSFKENVDRFAKAREIDSVIITNDGKLLFSGKKKLSFKSGVWTLQKALGLHHMPERLFCFDPLPQNFIIKYFADNGTIKQKSTTLLMKNSKENARRYCITKL